VDINHQKFDKIRSFHDSEVKATLQKLRENAFFLKIIAKLFPNADVSPFVAGLLNINTISEFQSKIISQFTKRIIRDSIKKLTYSGLGNLDPKKAYLFISTHRDIVLDSALLNDTLLSNGFGTTEIAIGGNLLIYDWIETIVKLNRSFIVRRDLHGKEMLFASQTLSEYIRKKIELENTSVWIAHREGRTKDGNDATQTALLKMLNMSGQADLISNFSNLNIVPLSISYEFETCISHKIKEIYAKRNGIPYQKTKEDDLQSMGEGIFGKKGEVHIHFGKPLSDELQPLNDIHKPNDRFDALKQIIDNQLHRNYYLTEGNYIGHDLFYNKTDFFQQGKYNRAQLEKFTNVGREKTAGVEGNKDELFDIFCEIYAMPLENKLKLGI